MKQFNEYNFKVKMHNIDYATFEGNTISEAQSYARSQNNQIREYYKKKGYDKYSHIILSSVINEGETTGRCNNVNVYSFLVTLKKVY